MHCRLATAKIKAGCFRGDFKPKEEIFAIGSTAHRSNLVENAVPCLSIGKDLEFSVSPNFEASISIGSN